MQQTSASKPLRLLLRKRLRRLFLLACTLFVLISGFFAGTMTTHAASYCQVTYSITNQWAGGFGANLAIQNTSGSTWSNWTLTFAFPASGQTVTQLWGGTVQQTGPQVTVTNASYNGSVASNALVNPAVGFNGSWTGSNPVPTGFSINGNVCNGSTTPTPTITATPTSIPTATPTSVPTATGTSTTGGHVVNPYVGAQGYIDPDWAGQVTAGAASVGGTLGAQEARVAQYPTAIWLDRIATLTGGPGVTTTLAGHLDNAEKQAAASGQPIVVTIVLYDLPDRDCQLATSNGELTVANNGLATYESQFIDPIAATLSQAKYSNLRIAAIIEPDSLANLVTNLSVAKCAEANSSGAYVQGIQYALNKLHAIPNVYNFLDISRSSWLGYASNFLVAVPLITSIVKGTTAGLASVDGFVSNVANYVPTTEPYMTASEQVGFNQVRAATFYEYNTFIDEASYDIAMRTALIGAGFPNSIGMLIDTSRNGWGGPGRPAGPSTSTDTNTFVNATRIDRRTTRSDWCNQASGIGARPQASPASGFDAYVWVKPPGESDGSSSAIANDEGKNFNSMCDPNYGGDAQNGFNPTGAMPNAPLEGHWFQAGFNTLVQNAYPSF